MPKKKKEVEEVLPPALTEMEYFRLEALEAKHRETELNRIIDKKNQQLLKKELKIMDLQKEAINAELGTYVQRLQSKQVMLENLGKQKQEVIDSIRERLGLEKDTQLSYNPDTLQLIL